MQEPSSFSSVPRIGIDLLGSDLPAELLLEAVFSAMQTLPSQAQIVLFGTTELFNSIAPPFPVECHPAQEWITMEDAPLNALRKKKNASLCQGIRQLKEGKLHAFISSGNTGALMACAAIELSLLPLIERPALMIQIPVHRGEMAVLDVGANASCQAEHLVQFALMGAAYQRSRGIPLPRIALLNIGTEPKKGPIELQNAYQLLLKHQGAFQFIGNVEGRDAFNGHVDVLVTDGFAGNVFLKTAEGIATLVMHELDKAGLTPEQQKTIRSTLNYTEYPGSVLIGVEGIVIKCHGAAGPQSMARSIHTAITLIATQFLADVKNSLHLYKGTTNH